MSSPKKKEKKERFHSRPDILRLAWLFGCWLLLAVGPPSSQTCPNISDVFIDYSDTLICMLIFETKHNHWSVPLNSLKKAAKTKKLSSLKIL